MTNLLALKQIPTFVTTITLIKYAILDITTRNINMA